MSKKFVCRTIIVSMLIVAAGCDMFDQPRTRSKRGGRLANSTSKKTTSLGIQGAQIQLDASWTRTTLNADLGKDQFAWDKFGTQMCLIVLETESLFECKEDFEYAFDEIGVLKNVSGRPTESFDITFERKGKVGHARTRFRAKFSGIKLFYDVQLIGKGDLGYVVMFWTNASQARTLTTEVDRVMATFKFPGADSDWASAHRLQTEMLMVDDFTVQFEIDKGLYRLDPDPGETLFSRLSPKGRVLKMVLPVQTGSQIEDVLDDTWGFSKAFYQEEGRTAKEVDRRDLSVAGLKARQSIVEIDGGDARLIDTIVELEPGKYLHIRYYGAGPANVRIAQSDAWLKTFRVDLPEALKAYPNVEVNPEPPWVSRPLKLLIQKAKTWPRVDDFVSSTSHLSNGQILATTGNGVYLLRKGAAVSKRLMKFEEYTWNCSALLFDGDLLIANDENLVHHFKSDDATLIPMTFRASILAPFDAREFLICRKQEVSSVPGLNGLRKTKGTEIWLRKGTQGPERRIAQLPGREVTHLSADGEGRRILAISRGIASSYTVNKNHLRLSVIDLEHGMRDETESFVSVQALGPAPDGWVIAGNSVEVGPTLSVIRPGEKPDRLATGTQLLPIRIDGDRFHFACNATLAPPYNTGPQIYSVDLDLLREVGPALNPFSGSVLNAISNEAFKKSGVTLGGDPLTTEQEVRKLFDAANQSALAKVGFPLPHDPKEVDALTSFLTGGNDLTSEAVVLVSVLVTNSLLEAGAEWVDADRSGIGRPGFSKIPDNDWAVGCFPMRLVLSTLYDSEGWWNPAQSILSSADGRTLFVGNWSAAVADRVRKASDNQSSPEAVADLPFEAIQKTLKASQENAFFRRKVYRLLAEQRKFSTIVQLAETFSTIKPRKYFDVQFGLASRLAQEDKETPQWAELENDLKEAIIEFPAEPATFVMLGQFYEHSQNIEARRLAAACYQKVIATHRWGPIADQANEALAKLKGDETD